MQIKEKKIRAIIATLGLEPHWRGAITIAGMLRDMGMEVIYIGNAYPTEIVQAAIQEDADIVGISSLSGSHLTLGSELIQIANQKGIMAGIVFVIGGIFPPDDEFKLKEVGFAGVFGPGVRGAEIYSYLMNEVTARAKHI